MAKQVTISPATLRDVSYVMGNLRPLDDLEMMCQMPEGTKRHEIAYGMLMAGDCYVAKLDDLPVMCFGALPINVTCLSVWALGTRHTYRVVPTVTRFFINELLPEKVAQGYYSMEARSLVEHRQAHRWMESTGAVVHGPAFVYGRGREKFLMFRWEADALPAAQQQFGSRK